MSIAMFVKTRLTIAIGMGLATLCITIPVKAFDLTYQGDTKNQPTWLRTAPGNPPSRVSGQNSEEIGMIVPYSTFKFTVEESGLYTFGSAVPVATSSTDGTWDNFLVLYQDTFNPTDQLTNALIAINAPNNGSLAFNRELTAGQNYFLVTTGRQLTDFGVFTNTINGAGKITAVPESASMSGLLAASGVGLLLYKNKRIRSIRSAIGQQLFN